MKSERSLTKAAICDRVASTPNAAARERAADPSGPAVTFEAECRSASATVGNSAALLRCNLTAIAMRT